MIKFLGTTITSATLERDQEEIMECNDIVKQLDVWMDQEISPGDARKLEIHLDKCPVCSSRARTMVQLANTMNSLPAIPAPKGFSRQVCLAVHPHFQYPDLVQWWHHLTLAWRTTLCGVAAAGLVCGAVLGTTMAGTLENDTQSVLYLSLADNGGIYP